MLPHSAHHTTIPSARPAPPALRERQQLAQRLLREASFELARLRRTRGAYRKTWRSISRAQARLAFAAALLGAPLVGPALAGTPSFESPFFPPDVDVGFAPAFADLDGDGDLDVFVGAYTGNTIFFANTGTPTAPSFSAPSTNPFGLADVGVTASPAFADLDGDGDLDALIGASLFRNTGTASAPAFAAPSTNPFGLVGHPVFADIDGDGDVDAFHRRWADIDGDGDLDQSFFFQRNTGTVSAPAFAAPSSKPFGLSSLVLSWPNLAFADIDGDGDLDAFIGELFGRTFFVMNRGTASAPAFGGGFSQNPFGLAHAGMGASPAFADIDGDGDLDAFVGSTDNERIGFFRNTGTVNFPAFASSTNPLGLRPRYGGGWASPAFADIDGDGDLDGFVGDNNGRTSLFENRGTASTPAFRGWEPYSDPFGLSPVAANNYYGGASPDFSDIDGDGDLDAFIGEAFGRTWFFRNTGTASAPAFRAPSTNPFGLGDVGFRASPAFADIDDDGDLDALVGEFFGQTILFANTGTAIVPAFAAGVVNPFGITDVGFAASPALFDTDGDGDLDAFVGEYYGNTLYFENTGTASAPAFSAPATNPFGLEDVGFYASPTFADLDGDGDLDVFVGYAVDPSSVYGSGIFFFENLEIDVPACADGLDNDTDGLLDYPADLGCADANDASEFSDATCDNGLDDDGDGRIDWRANRTGDLGCTSPSDPSEYADVQCDNGVDDDSDGRIDYPADPSCTSRTDNSELGTTACDDGVDNDGDGRADYPNDPGCGDPYWPTESPQCQDGVNNDGTEDALIDFDGGQSIHGSCSGAGCPPGVSDPNHDGVADPDPSCSGPTDGSETAPPPVLPGWSCGLGPELALLVPALLALRRRRVTPRFAEPVVALRLGGRFDEVPESLLFGAARGPCGTGSPEPLPDGTTARLGPGAALPDARSRPGEVQSSGQRCDVQQGHQRRHRHDSRFVLGWVLG